MSKEAKILSAIAVVVIAAGVVLFLTNKPAQPGAPVDNKSLVLSSSHMTGKQTAKVTIVEFGDYQCPACAAAQPIVKQVFDAYRSNPNFNFVFRNYPLPQHNNAQIASEAAEAAGAQGKYWEMNEKLYTNQTQWAESSDPLPLLKQYAQEIGLDVSKFTSEVQANKYKDIIAQDQSDGDKIGINATPTFFVNGEKNEGVLSLDQFKAKIEAGLK